MSRRNIYAGPDSCYCTRERIGCNQMGVAPTNVSYYLWAIGRDLARGWTYDHSCKRVSMTRRLAVRRATYLVALAKKHTRSETAARRVYAEVSRFIESIERGVIPTVHVKATATARRRVRNRVT